MTPHEIEILLHYHWSPKPFEDDFSAAIIEALERFSELGIFEKITILNNCYWLNPYPLQQQ